MIYRHYGKRVFDIVSALIGMVLLSPMLIVLTILVRIKLGTPILFSQQRPGSHGKSFTIFKFRTMSNTRDIQGNLLSDGDRLTTFGRFLRSTSLDELPELINVFKGEMSLVGPRPLLMQYLDRYTPQQMRRHEVRPGITGWAQINGRNAISWEEKFAYDLWYVDNFSALLDIKILALTILKTIRRENISEKGQATAQEFMGSRDVAN